MSKIGIVTVLYNSGAVLEEFFDTLNQQTFKDFTLYVIDNASKDNSLSEAGRLASEVSFKTLIFPEKENWGIAKGNNIGIRAALADGCEYVLLANNDIVLRPDTIRELLDGMLGMHADLAVPKIYYHDSGLIWCAGGKFRWHMYDTKHIGVDEQDLGQYNTRCYTEYSPTCFMLIKSSLFDEIGMMDEKYFVYYDDTDFVYRAVHKAGKRLAYIPTSTLRHKVSSCTGGTSDFSTEMMTRNGMYFVRKNLTPFRRILAISARILHTYLWIRIKSDPHKYQVTKKGLLAGLKMK